MSNSMTKRSLAYNCKHGKVKEERRCWFSFFFFKAFPNTRQPTLYAHFGGAYNIFPEVRPPAPPSDDTGQAAKDNLCLVVGNVLSVGSRRHTTRRTLCGLS